MKKHDDANKIELMPAQNHWGEIHLTNALQDALLEFLARLNAYALRKVRAIFPNTVSIKLSQEPCLAYGHR